MIILVRVFVLKWISCFWPKKMRELEDFERRMNVMNEGLAKRKSVLISAQSTGLLLLRPPDAFLHEWRENLRKPCGKPGRKPLLRISATPNTRATPGASPAHGQFNRMKYRVNDDARRIAARDVPILRVCEQPGCLQRKSPHR